MRFILLFTLLAAVCVSHAASLIGMDALGLEQSPQNAAMVRNGFAPMNPAANAFENKTKFGTTIHYEHTSAQKGNSSIPLNSFTMPSFSMVLPMGFLGTFGIGFEQKFFASNRLELIDPAQDANLLLSSRMGIYELAPSYSIRLPFLNDFSLGTSYRILFGNSHSTLERGRSKDWGKEDWMARNVFITEKETGTFESDDDWWRNFGYSMHMHRKSVDYFFAYFPAIKMQKNIKKNVQFSNTDTLQSTKETLNFELSEHFASGAHFRFMQNHNLSLVYEYQNDSAFSCFAEYKIVGTGLYYSNFLKRNNFGMNAWYAEKYLADVKEYGASLLSDMWLGRRGTLIGVALFGGYRDAKFNWNELFYGFKLNLTGVGNWGTSARRK
ncbi:MAG: hypothetical protein LBB36_01790 [Fibromonadaceae bacterium]|nr:hypothetical protein [Fibromonadaceae bacterium]